MTPISLYSNSLASLAGNGGITSSPSIAKASQASQSTAPSTNSNSDTVTLTLPDGSQQTTTRNPDGTLSVAITFSATAANKAPLDSALSQSAAGSSSKTTISLPDGNTGEITKNANGSYTLNFTTSLSNQSGNSSSSTPKEATSASPVSTSVSSSNTPSSSTANNSNTSNSSTTVTLIDGTLEKIATNSDGTQSISFSSPEDPTPPVSGSVVDSALARKAAHKKLLEGKV